MSIIATEPNLSIFIFTLGQVLSVRTAEKLRSHSTKVIENVHVIFNTKKLESLSSSYFLIALAKVPGRSLESTTNHLRYQSRSS